MSLPFRRRRLRPASLPAALVVLATVAACGTSTPGIPTAAPTGALGSPTAGSPSTSPGTELTPVPGGPTPGPSVVPTASGPRPGTTETSWGVILDALPGTFPVYPGSHEALPDEGPISGAFSAPADGRTVTEWYQAALEAEGFSTIALSGPFEDGQTVIDSEGAAPGCRVQTTIRPLSGMTLVTVLYAAACAG